MRKELLQGLSEEQIKKVEACKSSEEILALAKAEGVQLSDEQLEAVSGGGCGGGNKCPKCGSKDVEQTPVNSFESKYECKKCGHKWNARKHMA